MTSNSYRVRRCSESFVSFFPLARRPSFSRSLLSTRMDIVLSPSSLRNLNLLMILVVHSREFITKPCILVIYRFPFTPLLSFSLFLPFFSPSLSLFVLYAPSLCLSRPRFFACSICRFVFIYPSFFSTQISHANRRDARFDTLKCACPFSHIDMTVLLKILDLYSAIDIYHVLLIYVRYL